MKEERVMATQTLRLRTVDVTISLFVFLIPVVGQTVTGTLQGTVTDVNAAVVPGAEITVRNIETGQERNVRTNSDGFYVVSFLQLGLCNVSVAHEGFNTASS